MKCERQFGFETFQISVPSLPPGVVINDPKNLEYVFKNEGIFAKGDFFKRRSWDLFGKKCPIVSISHLLSCDLTKIGQEMALSMQMVISGRSRGRLDYISSAIPI